MEKCSSKHWGKGNEKDERKDFSIPELLALSVCLKIVLLLMAYSDVDTKSLLMSGAFFKYQCQANVLKDKSILAHSWVKWSEVKVKKNNKTKIKYTNKHIHFNHPSFRSCSEWALITIHSIFFFWYIVMRVRLFANIKVLISVFS